MKKKIEEKRQPEPWEPTDEEWEVVEILKKQAGKICEPDKCDRTSFESVLKMCEAWSLTPHFEKIPPEKFVALLQSLIKKGYVKQFTSNRMPSFVPMGYWQVREVTVKMIDQPTDVEYNSQF